MFKLLLNLEIVLVSCVERGDIQELHLILRCTSVGSHGTRVPNVSQNP